MSIKHGLIAGAVVWGVLGMIGQVDAQTLPRLGDRMTDQQVISFAKLALDGMDREFPNKPSNVMVDRRSVLSPREMHPAFYGCFDWHSSVHGHWMLIRLLRLYPNCSIAAEIKTKLDHHLTLENMQVEAEYFLQKHNRSFERMYGWAWALRLSTELHQWDHDWARQWRTAYQPLEDVLVQRIKGYLPKLTWPIRTGVHPDTAFALGQIFDYAVQVGDTELKDLVIQRSRDYYLQDRNYPIHYEPSGEDFFSAGLNEADLMRRVLSQQEYAKWLKEFLPSLDEDRAEPFVKPVTVSDPSDPKIVHLAGLNLSRGWTLQGIADGLPAEDARVKRLREMASQHADAGFQYVFSGHYEGEHWLATFAIYLLTEVGVSEPSQSEDHLESKADQAGNRDE